MYNSIQQFLTDWAREEALTLKVLERLTDESLKQAVSDTRPKTLGDLGWHLLVGISILGAAGLQINGPDSRQPTPQRASEIVDGYRQMSQAAVAALKEQWNDAKLPESLTLFGSIPITYSGVLNLVVRHQIHHRGQMTILMRQAGLVPPGVYGPNEEESAAIRAAREKQVIGGFGMQTGYKQERRAELYRLLGDLPLTSNEPITAKLLYEEERDGYVLENLVLELNGVESVPAYFVKPVHTDRPAPVILYNHAHGGQYGVGKDELLNGTDYLQKPSYAKALTKLGYSALCIDMWGFGDRYGHGKTESEHFKEMLWKGQVMWGMMVYDSLQAVRYLLSRPDVDPARIGTLGISMGSTMAWWVAALEPRVKVCADLCCMTDFHSLIESRGLDGHGIYYYVPGLLKHFTTAEINALIAPRPHISLNGRYDRLTPLQGLEKIDSALREAYAQEGAPEAWELKTYGVGHRETPEMRYEILRFLQQWL